MRIGHINHLPESYLRRVEITTQLGCSVGCTFCPQKTLVKAMRGHAEGIMSRETFTKILKNLERSIVREVHFSGFSEPFLHPECGDFIIEASQAGFEIVVFSVLKGLTRQTLEKIKDIPIKRFHVSIPPLSPDTRPGFDNSSAWHQIDMLLSIKHSFNLRFGCVDVNYSTQEKKELEKLCTARGIEVIYGEMLNRAGNLPEGKSKRHARDSHLICARDIGLVILPNGDCAWCCMDYGLRHCIGNLRDTAYNQLLCSTLAQQLLSSMGGSGQIDNLLCHQCESAHPMKIHERFMAVLRGQFGGTRIDCEL